MNLNVNDWILIVMTLTFVVYFFQLRAMRSSSRGQNILALDNFLQMPDVRDARRLVRTVLGKKEVSSN